MRLCFSKRATFTVFYEVFRINFRVMAETPFLSNIKMVFVVFILTSFNIL